MSLRSFSSLYLRVLGAVLLAAAMPASLCAAQAQPSPAAAAAQPDAGQSAFVLGMHDPTRPEAQPPLDLDRDPIPSIDPPTPPAAAAANQTNANPLQAQQGKNGIYVLHTDVDEVLLNCSVVDDEGHTVDGLGRKDFRVWEDGVPQTINAFLHQDQPVSMGILVDNSGSMRDKRAAVNAAAANLLRASNRQDAAFVVNFSDRAYLDQGFTTDLVKLDRGLARFDSGGTTALYDAVVASADELAKHGTRRQQVLLIITDGADNASRLTLQQAIRRVQNLGGPVVYAIGLLYDSDKREAGQARTALNMLTAETGGIAFYPASLGQVNQIAAEVAHDIRDQYIIAYHSSKPFSEGGYRSVHVEARAGGHKKLIVRTRHGYYANAAGHPNETAQDTQR